MTTQTLGTTERLTLTVSEAARTLGIARASAYQAVASGELESLRIGKRILIPRCAIERMLSGTRNKSSKQ